MLLIDVFLPRYDDLVDILRGSELKSQLNRTSGAAVGTENLSGEP
jgi:hypothetical protein